MRSGEGNDVRIGVSQGRALAQRVEPSLKGPSPRSKGRALAQRVKTRALAQTQRVFPFFCCYFPMYRGTIKA